MNVMNPRKTSAMLYLDGVHVSFDGFHAINNLSLALEPGEMRAIIGPNGAGKTTMMDIITGKTKPDEGTVLFDGMRHLLFVVPPLTVAAALAIDQTAKASGRNARTDEAADLARFALRLARRIGAGPHDIEAVGGADVGDAAQPPDDVEAGGIPEDEVVIIIVEGIERVLRLWSNRGELVLSPFGGIGSEGVVSIQQGRRFVGCELKPSYWRTAVANLRRAENEARAGTLFEVADA